jgi:hypothetical protein
MVMPNSEAAGDGLGEPAEVLPHTLADRLQSFEAGRACMRMDPDTVGGAVINRDEHRGRSFAGDCRRQVGAPHRVDCVGDDGAVMRPRSTR